VRYAQLLDRGSSCLLGLEWIGQASFYEVWGSQAIYRNPELSGTPSEHSFAFDQVTGLRREECQGLSKKNCAE